VKRSDLDYGVAILLSIAVPVTGLLGYLQAELELRRFVPHRYAAYVTLLLAAVHLALNFGKVRRYLVARFRRTTGSS
jgi:hypothetical protein